MNLQHVLAVSVVLFTLGVYGLLTRRNVLAIFMCLELLFAAASINFVAFNYFLHPDKLTGQAFALVLMTLAAAEAVVGLALVLAVHRADKNPT